MLTATSATYRRDLGDGLVLRWSTGEDTEKIAQLVSHVFRSSAEEPANTRIGDTVRRLMRGDHPLMGPGDYGLIEDTSKEGHPVVACTCLWRQDWEYEGIRFQIGRPEIVASDPNYRRRGLIRALFEMVHARSEAEGHLVQAITGIPYFYRQFGYEYALDLGGRRATPLSFIHRLKEGEQEPYTLREATADEIPFIQTCYNRRRASSIVWTSVPDQYWQYEIEAWKANPERDRTSSIQIIQDVENAPKGFLMASTRRWGRDLGIWILEVADGVNWLALVPPVLRALQIYGQQVPTHKPDVEPLSEISFMLGRTHPVYDALGETLAPRYEPPYAWYVRVRDLPAFLKLITPVLEKRLENSVVTGYTGELKLDFYRGGLRMVFKDGHLATAEHWDVPIYDSNAGAGFTALIFLQLLFGHRSLDELRYAFPEVWVNPESEVVLNALFPARPSYTLPL
jgi:GNAT superfamily N-acetyltransferase